MSDPNNLFIRERLRAGVRGAQLTPPLNAVYTNAGSPTDDIVDTFQPLIAPGSTVGVQGTRQTIPSDSQLNTVLRGTREKTTDIVAVSKINTHIIYPMTGGAAVGQGLLGSLGAHAQDATIAGVYSMEVNQPFVDMDSRLFVMARDDNNSAFSTAFRGALEWWTQLPVIQGSTGDEVSTRFTVVREDASTITALWRYQVSTQAVSFEIKDGEQTLATATGSLSNYLGIVMDPDNTALEFYLDGAFLVTAPLGTSDRFEIVALFEQHSGTFELNPAARFNATLTVGPTYFEHNYSAGALTQL